MPTPYIGRIRVVCGKDSCGLHADVKPGCLGCPDAVGSIIDLDDRDVARIERMDAVSVDNRRHSHKGDRKKEAVSAGE